MVAHGEDGTLLQPGFPIGQRLKINAAIFLVMYTIPLTVMFQLRPAA